MNCLERVVVLDAQQRHSLAIIRSLLKRGINVYACTQQNFFPARFSKYCSGFIKFNYYDSVDKLVSLLREKNIKIIIPAALRGNEFICKNADELKKEFIAPYNSIEKFEIVSNKYKTIEYLQNLGINLLKTTEVKNPAEIDVSNFHYPVVFKSVVDQGTVKYAKNEIELKNILYSYFEQKKNLILSGKYPIIQEYIRGKAYGFFSLSFNKRTIVYFMHERIHEVPPLRWSRCYG